jgi:ribosomal protein L29
VAKYSLLKLRFMRSTRDLQNEYSMARLYIVLQARERDVQS